MTAPLATRSNKDVVEREIMKSRADTTAPEYASTIMTSEFVSLGNDIRAEMCRLATIGEETYEKVNRRPTTQE